MKSFDVELTGHFKTLDTLADTHTHTHTPTPTLTHPHTHTNRQKAKVKMLLLHNLENFVHC